MLLQKRLKENEALALEFTAMELFEAASVAKGQDWADMADKQKYEELAEGKLRLASTLRCKSNALMPKEWMNQTNSSMRGSSPKITKQESRLPHKQMSMYTSH